ncbi:prolipoprotein diacylglyceryl transferase [Naumannella halotolerans]|uniref:Phosphatidylglycerol--prolipoprotein diacylglyceryl transferase n=1 Tax=Naumannella halotolerans TaxID=993414 RepID=A0A4R7J8D0_9ACTN|nr:prolipoprotein diacylglyceryl transferase [Naumannella halotolerans]TDT33555.1 prolipoprotein diacylglyceryl transferase [Naumannella halotolerans]
MLTFIPSPETGVWHLGPVPIRAYAICILIGIAVAYWISVRRWRARGGDSETLETILLWAIPFGFVGARLYHVITDYQLYFGPGREPIRALYVWEGGLGIWGAVALGALGAWIGCRRTGVRFLAVADTIAPGLLIAQAIGRLGNWFNQELFGRPTDLPWGLLIDPQYRPNGYEQYATFHPTFLYELLWNLLIAGLLLWADRRFRLGHGKVFALYVALYSLGRFFVEYVRIDTVNEIAGLRLNNYTSAIAFIAGLLWFAWLVRNRPGREESVRRSDSQADDSSTEQADPDSEQAQSQQVQSEQARSEESEEAGPSDPDVDAAPETPTAEAAPPDGSETTEPAETGQDPRPDGESSDGAASPKKAPGR